MSSTQSCLITYPLKSKQFLNENSKLYMEKLNRIIFPVRRYVEGTAATNRLLAYAKGFAELGIDVWIYFLITNEKEEKPNINNTNIHFIYLWENNNFLFRKYRGLGLFKNLLVFRKMVQKNDVLFVFGGEIYMFAAALSVSRYSKIFYEVTEHPFYNGKGWDRKLYASISLAFIKKCDGLFVISHSLWNYFITNGVKQEKICVINMFVDCNRFTNVVKDPRREKYIAYCGYVSRRKDGVDLLIKSFSLFHKEHPEYYLYIIGMAGFPEPLSYFENLAEELGVKKYVIFTGPVNMYEMPRLLVNAEILALSRPDSLQARNGFPTKMGEYLATGNPVVVTDVGEIPLFIKDNYNGFLVEASNVEEFATKLLWVANHPKEAALIGLNGKKLVNNEFSYIMQSKKALLFIQEKSNFNLYKK